MIWLVQSPLNGPKSRPRESLHASPDRQTEVLETDDCLNLLCFRESDDVCESNTKIGNFQIFGHEGLPMLIDPVIRIVQPGKDQRILLTTV